MTRYSQSRLLVEGLTGFSITLILNLFGLLFLKQAAAEFLSPKWSQV